MFAFLILTMLLLLLALAWVGGRYFLGLQMPSPSLALPKKHLQQVQLLGRKIQAQWPAIKQSTLNNTRAVTRHLMQRVLQQKLSLLLASMGLIIGIIGVTLHFKQHARLEGVQAQYQYGQRIMQSFADETLAPAAPLPPAVFTSSVTRQSICPAGHSNCNISAQLNSYFVSAAQRYNLEPALLAAIQQNEAPINNPSIVGPAPSEGDMNDRAIGLMQIRQSIARKLGIDPTSPEQSIFAAARLLSESLKRSNGNLARAVTEYHGGTNPANWGPKTENYVAKVFQHLHVIRAQSAQMGS